MQTIKVKEPESGVTVELRIQPVKSLTFPGWVILIPDQKNVLLYLKNGIWQFIPERISLAYAQNIIEKLKKLKILQAVEQ